MSNNNINNHSNREFRQQQEPDGGHDGDSSASQQESNLKTPANTLLPRKRNATKSPIPACGLGEGTNDLTAAPLDMEEVEDPNNDSGLNRNLHLAFDSINNEDEGESCSIDDVSSAERGGGDVMLGHEQKQSQSQLESRKKEKPKNEDDDDDDAIPYQQQTPPRKQPQPTFQQQQQQQQPMQSHTPMRPPNTQKQKRYRHSSHTLFSPKPIYRDKRRGGANSTNTTPFASGIEQMPPRPTEIATKTGEGNSHHNSPEVSQNALPSAAESMNTNNISTTTGSGYDSSPATPFRFHAFPASLPRVHLKNDVANIGSFSSTPFRLDESFNASQQSSGDNESNSYVGTAPRVQLRPKPTPSIVGATSKQPLPPPSPASRLPPLSPATRRLFDQSQGTRQQLLPLAPSFDAEDECAISDAVIAHSLSKDQDISGDWSDAGMTFTNERMKMAPSVGSIPSHVTSHGFKFLGEEDEEIDTVMEEGDVELDDADTKVARSENATKMPSVDSTETTMGTKLNFNSLFSPPQSTELSHPTVERAGNQSTLETTLHPHTPRSLGVEQFHIQNLEVSPIVRLPEDDDVGIVDGDTPMNGLLDEDESFKEKERVEGEKHRTQLQHFFRGSASPSSNFDISKDIEANTSAASSTSGFSTGSATATSASTANVNNATAVSNISSTCRPQVRKIRPMPDTSAFDVCTPSQQSLGSGSKDSGQTSHKTSASDRLLCPPTPIRTPAWAHAEGRPTFQRANSLISTKVLAACPPRVLDSLSSLEDSMLENDISGSTMDPDSHPMLSSSFAPVEEKDEDDLFEDHDDCMFRPLSENFDEQRSPLRDPGLARKVTNVYPKQGDGSKKTTANQSRFSVGDNDLSSIVSFSSDFDNMGILGSGAFADVYKVRSKRDQVCYAIKRTRRQFRGVRDRERAMAEVQTMQRLQVALESASTSSTHDKSHAGAGSHSKSSYGLYLLFFIRAWQEDGYFFCQTELCSRATCRQLRLSLTSEWTRDVSKYPSLVACLEPSEDEGERKRLLPERAIWQICHDISRGLFHIHSHGMVHYDIKPSNIFFVYNVRWGTICKIGDFGLAGDIGTTDDGQEGDTAYMPNELLSSCVKHPGADIFSLGLTLYELAAAATWSLPREGERWHELRGGSHIPDIPTSRSPSLVMLIQTMLRPNAKERPSAEDVSEHTDVKRASALSDSFLSQYVKDVQQYDSAQERELESAEREARRRSSTPVAPFCNINRDWSTRTPTNDGQHPSFL